MAAKVKKGKHGISKRRQHTSDVTCLEDLSPEIFFDIFDYLNGNEIYKSFSRLNTYFDELIQNIPHVHLDLLQSKSKFYRIFPKIFLPRNIKSIVLMYDDAGLLDQLYQTAQPTCLTSLTLLKVPARAFESKIPDILRAFTGQLLHLKIEFGDMNFTKPGRDVSRSFEFLLVELSRLKSLTLNYWDGIDSITYLPSHISNRTITTLNITLRDQRRLIPILYRFENLKTLQFRRQTKLTKRAAPSSDVAYYRQQLNEKETIEHPFPCRSIQVYDSEMVLDRIDNLLHFLISPTVVNMHLLMCQRPEVRNSIPRREPPFLDGPKWHNLISKHLVGTLREFYIEYEDADNIMSIRNISYVKKNFAQWSNLNPSWHVTCAYDERRRYLSFTFRQQNF